MSSGDLTPDTRGWVGVRRFGDWRALREWVVAESLAAGPGREVETLRILVAGTGAAWVLGKTLEPHLARVAGALPTVGRAEVLFGDLAGDLSPPFRAAPPVTQEILMEEALLVGRGEDGAPPGDVAQLAKPLLNFLDEQSGDRRIGGEESAFEAFAARAEKHFAEAVETDEGAVRLLALTRWLRRVAGRYREALEAAGRADADALRRRLLTHCEELRPKFERTRFLALGEDALRPADAELLAALAPDGSFVWALVDGAPDPPLPPGIEVRNLTPDETPTRDTETSPAPPPSGAVATVGALAEGAPDPLSPANAAARASAAENDPPDAETSPAPRPSVPATIGGRLFAHGGQPSLFAQPPPAAPVAAVPGPEERGVAKRGSLPTLLAPAGTSSDLVLRATDRTEEVRTAARLLRHFAHEAGDGPGDYNRCALAAQSPENYLEAAESVLSDCGIPLRTRLDSWLTHEPWVATLRDVLEFAGTPGRLSLGIQLLRSPFFRGAELPVAAGRAADLLAEQVVGRGIRDTNPLENFPKLAAGFRRDAETHREAASRSRRPERRLGYAAAQEAAATTLERLATLADTLAPIRDEDATFRFAVENLIAFARLHLLPPEEEDHEVRERALEALEQAAAAAPEDARAGGPELFARRIRRLLNRRTLPRRPSDGEKTESKSQTLGGVSLIAAGDAPLGDYDFVILLGMVDKDWPAPRPPNIFFPNRLLEAATRTRHAHRREQEVALLRAFPTLPRSYIAFTRPELEDSFPVGVSPLEVELAEATAEASLPRSAVRIAELEPPNEHPTETEPVEPLPNTLERSAPSAEVLAGSVSPTAIDLYAANPAQFFAKQVLRLPEERPLSDVPPATERGNALHGFLEHTYTALGESGLSVTEEQLDEVLAFFEKEFDKFARTMHWSDAEREVERRWLFGGDATPGAVVWFLREDAARGPSTPERFEDWIKGEVVSADDTAPALLVQGMFDRLDEKKDGSRRVFEYKSGRFSPIGGKPLQARLYARILEETDGASTDYAIPYFGNRRWIGPQDKPDDATQDLQIRAVRDGLARGDFPTTREGTFDFHLVVRGDLPDAAEDSTGESVE